MSAQCFRVPAARSLDLVITTTESDVLVYDLSAHQLHNLNQAMMTVWMACDGVRTIDEIVAETSLDRDVVLKAVTQLAESGLLIAPLPTTASAPAGSRRRLMKRAAVASIPAMVSVTSATASSATSPSSVCFACTDPNQCTNKNGCKGSCKDTNGKVVGSKGSLSVGVCTR